MRLRAVAYPSHIRKGTLQHEWQYKLSMVKGIHADDICNMVAGDWNMLGKEAVR